MKRVSRRRLAVLAAFAIVLSACGDDANPFELEVGSCFDDPDVADGRVFELAAVDCSQPHDNEVYAVLTLPDGAFPGVGDIAVIADEGCLTAFPGYVGEDYLESDYFASYLAPSAGSWEDGDRTIVCFLFDDAQQLTAPVGTNVG